MAAPMYFPRPYADEIIGSVIARACLHLGMRPAHLLEHVLGRDSRYASYYLPSDYSSLAWLTGLSADYLVRNHTVFPYVCAFMPGREAQALEKIITGAKKNDETPMLASLVKSVRRTNKRLRCCPHCIKNDAWTYGESYWRLSHQLPCVYICPLHRCPLFEATLRGDARSRSPFACGAPNIENAVRTDPPLPFPLIEELTQRTLETLLPSWRRHDAWFEAYRDRALSKGYSLTDSAMAGSQLSVDLQAFYGEAALAFLNCSFASRLTAAWPALMLRRANATALPFSPIKHILLATFLANCTVRTTKPDYRPPGKVTGDYQRKDEACAKHVQKCWDTAKQQGTRLEVRKMLEEIGLRSAYRHDTKKFPKTVALLNEFRKSDQAARQAGYRPYWRKRLGLDRKSR